MEEKRNMQEKYSRTNIFIMDESLWKWAKFQADKLGKTSVSEYLFELIQKDKNMIMPPKEEN